MNWIPTIYVVGNAYPFTQGLIGLSMLFNPSNGLMTSSLGLGSLPALGLIFSLLFLAVKGISTQRVELHNILIMLVLFLVMFVPTTSVTVETITDGQVFGPYSGIPVGIAYTAGIVSEISTDFSEAIGTAFQPVSATQGVEGIFGPQGYMGPLTQLEAIHGLYNQFSNNDHYDVQSMMAYMSHCESYNLSQATGASTSGAATQTQVLNAGIASNAIFSSPPPGLTVVYGPQYPNGSESMTCTAAATAIQGSISAYMNDTNGATHPALNLSYSAMKLAEPVGPVAPTGDGAGNSAIGPDTIGADLQTVFCSGGGTPSSPSQAVGCSLQSTAQTGVQFMENDIYGCLFDAGLNYARNPLTANLTGALPGYCDVINNAMTVQQTNNAASATLFGINLLPMMSILQFMFIALTPLVALIMVSAGTSGIGIAGKFIFFGIWTQSWLPVAAIINDYSQDTISNTFALGASYALGLGQGVGYAASGPGQVVPFWTSIGSLPLFFQKLELQLNAANTMLGLTPVVTLAIFTGAFTVLGRLAQDMQGAGGATRGADGIEAPTMGAPTMTGATGSYSVYQRTMAGNGSLGSGLSAVAEGGTGTVTGDSTASAASSVGVGAVATAAKSFGTTVGVVAQQLASSSAGMSDGRQNSFGESSSTSNAFQSAATLGQSISRGLTLTKTQQAAVGATFAAYAKEGLSAFGDGAGFRQSVEISAGVDSAEAAKLASNAEASLRDNKTMGAQAEETGNLIANAGETGSTQLQEAVSRMDNQAGQVSDAVRLNETAQQTAVKTRQSASKIAVGIKEATQLADSTPGGWTTLNNRVMNGPGVTAGDQRAIEQTADSPTLRALYPTNAGQRTFAAALDYATNNSSPGGLAVSGGIIGLVDPDAGAAVGQVSARAQALQSQMGGGAGAVIAGMSGGNQTFSEIAGNAGAMPANGQDIRTGAARGVGQGAANVAATVAVDGQVVDYRGDMARKTINSGPVGMPPAKDLTPRPLNAPPPAMTGSQGIMGSDKPTPDPGLNADPGSVKNEPAPSQLMPEP
ncbi:MAG: conjugal transfer protein TraG N-terminal domain-containing protein [Acidiphilium sp.]|nr:conjugal transfer protein TraG N-terminal domain-containing protein [Acidiphilium sp.]